MARRNDRMRLSQREMSYRRYKQIVDSIVTSLTCNSLTLYGPHVVSEGKASNVAAAWICGR